MRGTAELEVGSVVHAANVGHTQMEGGEIMNKQHLKDIFSGDKIDAY